MTGSLWKQAKLGFPAIKNRITIQLDKDVLLWLKGQGKGYQGRINAILRSFMQAQG